MRAIDAAIRQGDYRDQFDVRSHWAVRIDDLQELLLRYQPDIVHFSGHGSNQSEIMLQDAHGNGVTVPTAALSNLFRLFREHVRCVVLSTCYADGQAMSIAQHIDCVVGMSDAISDQAARKFTTAFYRAVGYGRTVQEAFELGCSQIELSNLQERYKPKLLAPRVDPAQLVFAVDGAQPLSPAEMHALLARYRQRLLAETRYVKLEGIPLPSDTPAHAIPLQRVYIHIQALEERQSQQARYAEERALLEADRDPQKRHRLDLFDLISRIGEYQYRRGEGVESAQRPAPVDPLAAICKHRHLVLLGAPGAGKSTLLRYLTHQSAMDEQGKIPILVFLGAFALAYRQDRQLSLREWAITSAAPHDDDLRRALSQMVAKGEILWLFDGLDEAGDLREEISRQIGQFAFQAQIVVTSRPHDYRRTHLEEFAHFEALPLTTANVEQFITDWLTILAEQQGKPPAWIKECSDWLQQQLAARPRLQALTQNPLLLTFLVILARHDPRQDLPTRRSDLYRRYLEELFSAWEQRRQSAAVKLDKNLYLRGIEAIAWYLHLAYFGRTQRDIAANNQDLAPSRSNIQQKLATALNITTETAGQLIDFWLQTGLIEERQWQAWQLLTFRHLTFQEYGVATVLHRAWQQDAGRAWHFLRPRLHHFAWRESLLLLAEQMATPEIDQLVKRLLRHPSPYDRTLQRDLHLAATLVGEGGAASTAVIQQIVRRLTWHIREHLWQLLLVWLLLSIFLIVALSFALTWIIQMPIWLAGLIGFCTLAIVSIAIWQNVTARAVFLLPTRWWLMNNETRSKATTALEQLGNSRAVGLLITALRDTDKHMRHIVIKALEQLGDRRAVEPLLSALSDTDMDVRHSAAKALGQLGDSRAAAPLLSALHDPIWFVRHSAADALGQLGDSRAVAPLITALHDPNEDVRHGAAKALGQLGEVALEALTTALHDPERDVRLNIAKALGQLNDSRAVEPLITALHDPNEDVRLSAADALGQLGDHRAVEPLITALGDTDMYVCLSAADALGKLGDHRAVEPLLTALCDTNVYVRHSAAKVLGQLGDSRAVEPLLTALHDTDMDVRHSAAEALGQLGDSRAVEPLLTALRNTHMLYVSSRALAALRQLGDVALEPLLAALRDPDRDVRHIVVVALGQLGNSRAVEPLITALRDTDEHVRVGAAHALGQLGDGRAVEPLITALRDTHRDVRGSAAEALGRLGDGRVVEPLLTVLRDPDEWVHGSAADALRQLSKGHIKPETIASILWWRLTDPIVKIDEDIIESLAILVSRFPVTALLDDLLLPFQSNRRRRK
ncbi:MAG: HEAT repeat domain-containing protein [Caldilineaceae bacterium]